MVRRAFLLLVPCAWLAAGGTACSSSEETPAAPTVTAGVQSLYRLPTSLGELSEATFYDHPFPSDFRREPDGTARFTGLYNPRINVLLRSYVEATVGLLQGFSPAAPIYLRFTGAIDASRLPTSARASVAAGSTVRLLDCDARSPERGKARPVSVQWRRDEGVYVLSNTLAVIPALGQPLRPSTRYALVVTRGVAAEPSSELRQALGLEPAVGTAASVTATFAPCLAEVKQAGVDLEQVAHATVFTTNDPTAETFAVADEVVRSVPAPTASAWTAKEQRATFDVYEGVYGPSPNFQAGKVPYREPADGGGFAFDAAGKPRQNGSFDARFVLAVPKASTCPAPAAGYPLVLYAHGTGGNYRSVVAESNSTAESVAALCMASMGVDQIFHGTRPGAPAEGAADAETQIQLTFFNFNNPRAARTNGRQSAIDVLQQARLFTAGRARVPASVSRTGAEIAFDASRLVFYGHSQGGVNGPLFLAASDLSRGGVLSGTGAMLSIALLEKTKPMPSVAVAVRTLLELIQPDQAAELDVFHPAIALAQSLVDATDPLHYMPRIIREPRAGATPKSVYQTEGISPDGTGDSYAPPHGIEVAAIAMGLPRALPGVRPLAEAEAAGLGDVAIPPGGLAGNLAGGKATGVLAQFVPPPGRDGHFVIRDVPAARVQAARFCRNLASDGLGRVEP